MSIEINITDNIVEVTPTEQQVDINITENPIEVNVTDAIIVVAQTGLPGPQGPPGPGVAVGGTAGQILAKNSSTNYDTLWINAGVGTVTSVNASGVSGISVSGGPITSSGTLLITNTAPDQVVSLTGAGTTLISGTYPTFTITSNDEYDGTVTSVNASGGVGISVSGVPITSSGTLTITNTAPDQVVSLTGTGTTSISGTYPSFTINSADQYSGTVTSVGLISGTGIAVSGGPVTSSGNITVTNTAPDQIVSLSGSGTTTISGTYPSFTISSADQYIGTVTSIATTAPITGGTITASGTIGITQSGISTDGYLSSTDWNTFNNKQGTITLTTTGTSGVSTLIGNTLNIPNYGSVLTGYVPYTGATTNVDLGEFELKAGQLTLDVSPTGTAAVGTTRWNNTIGSSETTLKGGTVILKNGVDLVARVVNKVTPNQTLTKADYKAVRVSGAQGQRLAVELAQANNDNNSADTIGLITETIATNQEGFIITVGQLEEINTTGSLQGETWVDGDVLYLSPFTAGALTRVKPTGNGHIVVMGYVEYAHAIHGKIYVKVMNGWELDELHDVSIVSPTNNQGLFYTSSTSLWENKTIATALGYTPVNKAGDTMTGSLILNADPVSGLGAATKDYVDNLANGIDWKQSANAGTVAVLPSYSVTGSGQILTGSVNGAIPSVTTDGVTLVAGNRLLVKSETSTLTPNNGIYVVTQSGDGSSPFILTRSADANASSELSEATLSISSGSTLSNTQWHCNPASTPITIGTTYISFSQIGSGVYFGTAPISVSGNTISISQSSGSTNGYLSSTDWTTFNNKQNTLSLTTTGASGSSTLVGSTLNVPTYTLNGLGGASATTTLTINGTSYDLSANRTWSVGTVTSVGLSSATSGVTIGSSPVTTSGTITLAIATASGSQNGLLSSTDWTTFNGKQNAITLTTTGTSGAATLVGATLNIPQYQAAGTYVTSVTGTSPIVSSGGTTPDISIPAATTSVNGYLTSTDWNTFNNKQNALSNPVTGTGTTNYLPKFTGASTIGNSLVFDNGTNVGINTTSPSAKLTVNGTIYSDNNGLNNFALNSVGTNYGFIQNDAADKWSLGTGTSLTSLGTPILTWHKNGNVTIGTTTDAGYKLDVNGTGRFSGLLTISGVSNNNFQSNRVGTNAHFQTWYESNGTTRRGYFGYGEGGSNNFFLLNEQSGTLNIGTNGATNLTIASTGAATFSSSVQSTSLIVAGSGYFPAKLITLGGAEFSRYNTNIGTKIIAGSQIAMVFGTRSNNVDYDDTLTIYNGNVGIGTTSPTATLSVVQSTTPTDFSSPIAIFGGSGADSYAAGAIHSIGLSYIPDYLPQVAIGYTPTSTAGYTLGDLLFATRGVTTNTAPTERMRITSGGNVLIGSTTDNGVDKLQVTGSGKFTTGVDYNVLKPTTTTSASTATLTPNLASGDTFTITAQAAGLSVANPTGTPVNGQKMIIRIKDNGTARAITWSGTQYRASSDLALPTTTIINKTMYLGFIWNSTDSKWDMIAFLNNF
jgi:hypothetical protein